LKARLIQDCSSSTGSSRRDQLPPLPLALKEPLIGYSRVFLSGGVNLRVDFEAPLRVSNLVQTGAVKGRKLGRR
jgi:hypothetical protein